jgi:hypothetical protein
VRYVAREALRHGVETYQVPLDSRTLVMKVTEAFLTAMTTTSDDDGDNGESARGTQAEMGSPATWSDGGGSDARGGPPRGSTTSMPPPAVPSKRVRADKSDKRAASPTKGKAYNSIGKGMGQQRGTGCNRSKSRCLKLYCVCFAGQRICLDSCNCDNCANSGHEDDTLAHAAASAEVAMKKRYNYSAGCQCMNSNCLKKYCVCFRDEIACSKACKCVACENQYARAGCTTSWTANKKSEPAAGVEKKMSSVDKDPGYARTYPPKKRPKLILSPVGVAPAAAAAAPALTAAAAPAGAAPAPALTAAEKVAVQEQEIDFAARRRASLEKHGDG